jgi:hypothetical protein
MKKDSIAYALYVDAKKSVLYLYDAYEEMPFNDYILQTFKGKPLLADWKLPKHAVEHTNFPLNDFVDSFSRAPFVSERAKQALEPILKTEAEFRAIGNILGKPHYIMNVTNVVDCLDETKSDIVYSPDDGRVLSLRQAVFVLHRIPEACLFSVPQDVTPIYATDRFVEVVRKYRLTGVGFEPSNHVGVALRNDVFPDLPLREGVIA